MDETSSETHPCERVFGSCVGGDTCPFKDAPRAACLAFLKNRCRFGPRCKEPHLLLVQGKYVPALHPCVRIYGSCRYGDQCEYASLSSDTCIKFLKGRCSFGDRCKEQHPGTSGWSTSTVPGMNSGFAPGMGMGGMGFDMGFGGMGMGLAPGMVPQLGMQMLGMPPFAPFGFVPNFGVPDDGGGRGKRTRDGENGANGTWKKQQTSMDALSYFQATGGGRVHPCIRIYGTCKNGLSCKYAMMPIGACLQNFKGSCKFGDKCREQHIQIPGQELRPKGPGSKHPCERIYGFCQDGELCRFAEFPAESCLMFLKGRCRFGESCRELHARDVDTDAKV